MPNSWWRARSGCREGEEVTILTSSLDAVLPALVAALDDHGAAVLVAAPGAGKTTRAPLALLDSPWLAGRSILMLEPRRLAARAAAAHMAHLLGERVGERVGYQVRHDGRHSADTRILVVTEGILTRMLQDDPALDRVGLVIFDEFHERSLIGDTGLALTVATRDLLGLTRRILVMSATIDGAAVSGLLGDAPVITSEGRRFPVVTSHHPARAGERLEAQVARVVRDALSAEPGSLLVFLPGTAEIRRTAELLRDLPPTIEVHPLHGALPADQQDAAIAPAPPGRRKVVLATNIAETSLTIEGIRVVVDGGWHRMPRFSPRTGMTRLDTVRISRASAEQRRGRAGRLEPGACYRCWSAAEEQGMAAFDPPEIVAADLAPLALDLAAAGFDDPTLLPWLDPPPAAAFRQARDLLTLLGALDTAGHLTPHGRAMADLGTHPRFAHLLLRAREDGAASLQRAAALVALLEERDMLRGEQGPPPSDLTLRLDAVERDLDPTQLGGAAVDHAALRRVRDGAAAWRRRVDPRTAHLVDPTAAEDAGLLLAWAFPDRVAQQRGGAGRFVLRNGRGATLRATDPLAQAPWLVVPHLDDEGREARIYLAAPVAIDALVQRAAEQVITVETVALDERTGGVTATRRTMLGHLTISARQHAVTDGEQCIVALLDGIRARGLEVLPWTPELIRLRQRLAFLQRHDATWPTVDDGPLLATLDGWLGPMLAGIRRLDAITPDLLRQALLARIPPAFAARLDVLAPERFEVPTGSRIAIDYDDPDHPVLAVRLQEVFGLLATPRIAGGAVPLTMHLLSPARRPVQVTRDLASFWATGYFEVRKDLRGRYPKHAWPDDPLRAPPTRGRPR